MNEKLRKEKVPNERPPRLDKRVEILDRLRACWLNGFSFITSTGAWGTTRAEDAQATPTQSHISPSILVYWGGVPLPADVGAAPPLDHLAGPAAFSNG